MWIEYVCARTSAGKSVLPESITVVKEKVFGLHVSQVQFGVFSTKDNLVPQYHLI